VGDHYGTDRRCLLFLSSKFFTHHLTQSASEHVSSHTILIRALIPDTGITSLQENLSMHFAETRCPL